MDSFLWVLHQIYSFVIRALEKITGKDYRVLRQIYSFVINSKLMLYQAGILKCHKLDAQVISIGNITLGGVGKTPAVIEFARVLTECGLKTAVLFRGYHSKYEDSFAVVSDGKEMLLPWYEAGDEPYLVAKKLPAVPVLIGKNRYNAGKYALSRFGVEYLLLDDGFTHLPLHRDIDIILINSCNPFGSGDLFPTGTLREPLSSLKRADFFLLTKVDQVTEENRDNLIKKLTSFNSKAPIFQSIHSPTKIYNIRDKTHSYEPHIIKDKRVMTICGIGDPYSFEYIIMHLGAMDLLPLRFGDHHHYTNRDILKIIACVNAYQPELIITTEKDGLKLGDLIDEKFFIMAMEIRLILLNHRWEEFLVKSSLYRSIGE